MIKAIKKLSNIELVYLFKDVSRTYRMNEFKEYVPSSNTINFLTLNDIELNYQSIVEIDNYCRIEVLKRISDGRISINE